MPRAANFVQRYCSVETCSRKHYARGWCSRHYGQWRVTGNPIASRTHTKGGEPISWLRAHVSHNSDDCLPWPFARTPQGYANLGSASIRNANRLMCQLAHGTPSDPKMHVAHSCGQGHRGCINPRHLRWATRSENEQDKIAHRTSNDGMRNGMVKLTDADVQLIRELSGRTSHEQIGRMFGVLRQTVDKIVKQQRWKRAAPVSSAVRPINPHARASTQGWWRRRVLKRDHYRCTCCGGDDRGLLNAHHIEPYSVNEVLRWAVDNGATLCAPCHLAYHRQYGVKKANASTFALFLSISSIQAAA